MAKQRPTLAAEALDRVQQSARGLQAFVGLEEISKAQEAEAARMRIEAALHKALLNRNNPTTTGKRRGSDSSSSTIFSSVFDDTPDDYQTRVLGVFGRPVESDHPAVPITYFALPASGYAQAMQSPENGYGREDSKDEMLERYLNRMYQKRVWDGLDLLYVQARDLESTFIEQYTTWPNQEREGCLQKQRCRAAVPEKDKEAKQIGDTLEAFFSPRRIANDLFNNSFSPTNPSVRLQALESPIKKLAFNPRAPAFVPKQATTKFKAFGELPNHLRMHIWDFGLPGARLVKLGLSKDKRSIYSSTPIPALLHACRESRSFALKFYRLSFATYQGAPRTYFNFELDVIYTSCDGCISTNCGHKKTWTEDHRKVRGLVYVAPLSFSPFTKINRLFPAAYGLILIRGSNGTQQSSNIRWDELEHVSEPFEWQEGTLIQTYQNLALKLEDKVGVAGASGLQVSSGNLCRIQRMMLPGIMEKQLSTTGASMWMCCR
ncbi:hypothetical protein B0O99DRAFT_598502 [Bisporella sp. PMI_857]|nr:hypothetical protein B0O99DRAFT_598502 [Bisporella sp. PMI_857]